MDTPYPTLMNMILVKVISNTMSHSKEIYTDWDLQNYEFTFIFTELFSRGEYTHVHLNAGNGRRQGEI